MSKKKKEEETGGSLELPPGCGMCFCLGPPPEEREEKKPEAVGPIFKKGGAFTDGGAPRGAGPPIRKV